MNEDRSILGSPESPQENRRSLPGTREALAKLVPAHTNHTLRSLGESALLADLFLPDIDHQTWRINANSTTLRDHFPAQGESPACPVVPLVGPLGLWVLRYGELSVACSVRKPLFGGEEIGLSRQNHPTSASGITVGGEMAIEFSKAKIIDKSPIVVPDNVREAIGTNTLPHGPGFRFVRNVKTDPNRTFFQGGYTVSSGTLGIHQKFDVALLPEVVAQIGAVVGTTIVNPGTIFVYSGGIFEFEKDTTVTEGDTIRVRAHVTEKDLTKGIMKFRFEALRASDGKILLRGEVHANAIEFSKLIRACDIARTRRRKKS